MTPLEINKAIAEHCGTCFPIGVAWIGSVTENAKISYPDYYNDLNAIVEVTNKAEKGLFYINLYWVVADKSEGNDANRINWHIAYKLANATAPQRCEAYLKTIGKWRPA